MNAKNRIYTGKVSKWGLPDGTVVAVYNDEDEMWLFSPYYISPIEDSAYQCYLTEYEYKIKSLPAGYKFNAAGEIVKEEAKRYWDGKEPLEVGMVVLFEGEKCKIKLPSDSELNYVLKDRIGQWVIVDKSDLKPVDTRTKKEKAIDEVLSTVQVWTNREVVEYCYDKWVGNDQSPSARNKVSIKTGDGILTTSVRSSDLNIAGGSDE